MTSACKFSTFSKHHPRSSVCAGDTPGDLVLRWGQDTFQHLLALFNSPDGANAGTQLVSGYQLWQVIA